MPRIWYMFFIILISFVAIFVIFLMFDFHSQNHLIATDLQQAVTEDLQLTRDDSARMEKGVYAINQQKFINNLEWNQSSNGSKPRIMIKSLNDTKESSTGHAPYDFIIRFLSDNEQTDNQSKNRDYNSNYQHDINHQVDNNINPIRGVQVIAIPYKNAQKLINYNHDNNSNSSTKSKDMLKDLQEMRDLQENLQKIHDLKEKSSLNPQEKSTLQTLQNKVDEQPLNSKPQEKSILKKLDGEKYISSIIIQSFDKDANKGITNGDVRDVTKSSSEFNKYLYDAPYHTHNENNSNAKEVDLTDNDN